MNLIRAGRVSAINHAEGKVQVAFVDRNEDISNFLPYLNLEYKMPEIDEMVITIHFSNGTVSGVVLGGFWNDKNKPLEAAAGLYRKELSKIPGVGMIRYTDNEGLRFTAPKITLDSTSEGIITVADVTGLIQRIATLEEKVKELESKV